jgi:hypothetical protein
VVFEIRSEKSDGITFFISQHYIEGMQDAGNPKAEGKRDVDPEVKRGTHLQGHGHRWKENAEK